MKKITEYINENLKNIVGVVLALTILGVFYWNKKVLDSPKQEESRSEWAEVSKNKEASGKKKAEKDEDEDENEIIVDVKGAVKKPGIYKLSSKNRVSDAVASAGGFTEEAERMGTNLAKKLKDEAEVYVPVRGEADTNHLLETKDNTSKTVEKTKININTADLTELQQLSGVGAKKAQDILDYRSENGSFQSVEELTKVSGFGPKTLEKLKEAITVD